jgi:hypothetical protein
MTTLVTIVRRYLRSSFISVVFGNTSAGHRCVGIASWRTLVYSLEHTRKRSCVCSELTDPLPEPHFAGSGSWYAPCSSGGSSAGQLQLEQLAFGTMSVRHCRALDALRHPLKPASFAWECFARNCPVGAEDSSPVPALRPSCRVNLSGVVACATDKVSYPRGPHAQCNAVVSTMLRSYHVIW